MSKKTLLLCGHHSRYGLAHLRPILASPEFDVRLIVLGSDWRWDQFRMATAPDAIFVESLSLREKLKRRTSRLRALLHPKHLPTTAKQVRRLAPGIPVKVVDDINDGSVLRELAAAGTEVLLSTAFPQIFSRELIELASDVSINFHPSALPRCRGAHPHFWSIVSGEKIGGVTAHLLTEQLDAGHIIAQRTFRIDHLNYSQLYDRIVAETPSLVRDVAAFVTAEQRRTIPQDQSRATLFRNERIVHRRIFWREQKAQQIENLSRTGVAFCFFQGQHQVTIADARAVEENRNLHSDVRIEPGTIVDMSNGAIVVKSVDQCVEIREVRENGRAMRLPRWINRHKVTIGHQFA